MRPSCPEVILGIETSCDDTCAAVVVKGHDVQSSVISSQDEVHREFGGVVPELAARKHVENIPKVVSLALKQAKKKWEEIDGIAVSNRYGLASSLFIGVSMAKALAFARNLPLIGTHHVEGHMYSNFLEHPDMPFPYISLTVAGGHSLLVLVKQPFVYQVLGQSIDDAVGEAYDKVARCLGLGFPGGPVIDKIARENTDPPVKFTPPMMNSKDYSFSFSGIKTSVRYYVETLSQEELAKQVSAIATGFQEAVVKVLVSKTIQAAKEFQAKAIALSGGVAANSCLRARMKEAAEKERVSLYFPKPAFCTDNAAMVAGLGYYKFLHGQRDDLSLDVYPEASLV